MNVPTQLTVLRIILTPVFLFFLFSSNYYFNIISFVVFTIASLTDWYDGYYAKKYGHVTKLGKFLDPLADKILVSAALIAFYHFGYVKLWIVIVIITRDFLITGLRSYALFKKQQVATSFIARVKTSVQMTSIFIIFLILLIEKYLFLYEKKLEIMHFLQRIQFVDRLMLFVALLTIYTAVKYFYDNWVHIVTFSKSCINIFKPKEKI